MDVFSSLVHSQAVQDAHYAYHAARPFPHVVLDNWFDDRALNHLCRRFDDPEGWHQYEDNKRGLMQVANEPVVRAFQDGIVRAIVEEITGIPLLADPTLRGGGLHSVGPGGRLGIHVDFNRHPDLPLQRRVNTLLYLNPHWSASWRGNLTLTDRTHPELDVEIEPRWNRWVIFGYSEEAWHGHPEPLQCPADRDRRALAIYYYVPLTDPEMKFHTTIYTK